MQKFNKQELSNASFLTATDVRNRKIVRTVSVHGFQVGLDNPGYKPGLLVWGGIDMPSDDAPEHQQGRLYAEKSLTGYGVLKFGGLPVLGASADFVGTPWYEQLAPGESNGEVLKLPSTEKIPLAKGLVHHLDSKGKWNLSRGISQGIANRPNLPNNHAYLETSVSFAGITRGSDPDKDGVMTRGWARFERSNLLNVPEDEQEIVGRALYLSTTESGKLDFEIAGMLIGTATAVAPDGSILVFVNISSSGNPGPPGSKGIQGDPGPQGIQGLKGDQGDKGDKGDQGDQGDPGPQGIQGLKGDQGDQGDKGDKGDKGDQGDPGPQGDPGSSKSLTLEIDEPIFYRYDLRTSATDSKNTRARVIKLNLLNISESEISSVKWEVRKLSTPSSWILATNNATYLTTSPYRISSNVDKAIGATLSVSQFRSLGAHNRVSNGMMVRATVQLTFGSELQIERAIGILESERPRSASLNVDSNFFSSNEDLSLDPKIITFEIIKNNFSNNSIVTFWKYGLTNNALTNWTTLVDAQRTGNSPFNPITINQTQFRAINSTANQIWIKAEVYDSRLTDPANDSSNNDATNNFVVSEHVSLITVVPKIKGDKGDTGNPGNDGNDSKSLVISVSPNHEFHVGTDGQTSGFDPRNSDKTVKIKSSNFILHNNNTVAWFVKKIGDASWTAITNANYLTANTSSVLKPKERTATISLAQFNLFRGADKVVQIRATVDDGGETFDEETSIYLSYDGEKGDPGTDGTNSIPSLKLSSTSKQFLENPNDSTFDPASISFTAVLDKLNAADVQWLINDVLQSNNDKITRTNALASMTKAQFDLARNGAKSIKVSAKVVSGGQTYIDSETISLSKWGTDGTDGTNGNDGNDAVPQLVVSPSSSTFNFNAAGSSSTSPSVQLVADLLNVGSNPYSVSWSLPNPAQLTLSGVGNKNASMSPSQYLAANPSLANRSVTATATVIYGGITYTSSVRLNHTLDGQTGATGSTGTIGPEGPNLILTANTLFFLKTRFGDYQPASQIINFSVQTNQTGTVTWKVNGSTSIAGKISVASGNLTATMNQDQFTTNGGSTATVEVLINGLNSTVIIREMIVEDTLGIDPIIQMEAGSNHTLALTSSGKVYGWGSNTNYQLGNYNGLTNTSYSIPKLIWDDIGNKKAIKIQAGENFSGILTLGGALYVCGSNSTNRTGLNAAAGNTNFFSQLQTNIEDFALGRNFGVSIDSNNRIWTWGQNSEGQCAYIYDGTIAQFGIAGSSALTAIPTPQSFVADSIISNSFVFGSPDNTSDGFKNFVDLYATILNNSNYELKVYAGFDHAGVSLKNLADNTYQYVTWGNPANGALAHVSAKSGLNWVSSSTSYSVNYTNWAPRFVQASVSASPFGDPFIKKMKDWSIGYRNNAVIDDYGNVWVWGQNTRNIQPLSSSTSLNQPQSVTDFSWDANASVTSPTSNSIELFGFNKRLGKCLKVKLSLNLFFVATTNGIYTWGAGSTSTNNIKQQFGRGLGGDGSTSSKYVSNGSRAEPGLIMNEDSTQFSEFSMIPNFNVCLALYQSGNSILNALHASPRGTLAWGWGYDSNGRLGIGNTATIYYPKANRLTTFDNLIRVNYLEQINNHTQS